MKTIAIYYIATDDYKLFFKPLLKSLHNFFPGIQKEIMLISDGLSEYKNCKYSDEIHINLCRKINHYPWPIVTLYKHWHILLNFNEDADYHCYLNANTKILPNNPDKWFIKDKLNVSYHSFGKSPTPMMPANIKINPKSMAYIKNDNYEYVLAGFFIGKRIIVKQMCLDILKMINKDFDNCIIAQWHDESYFNKWCVEHINLVNKRFILTLYNNCPNDTFILLPIKPNKITSKFKRLNK